MTWYDTPELCQVTGCGLGFIRIYGVLSASRPLETLCGRSLLNVNVTCRPLCPGLIRPAG